ncbi:ribonuclease HI [Zafaria cholistanensis]|uniref:ribonuclease HI n=1 Tax=Zafaria cholistanensis TaxID=1682741 RepID=UPI0012314390|nr:RNase H family protein [Zafaria cholistanensis]
MLVRPWRENLVWAVARTNGGETLGTLTGHITGQVGDSLGRGPAAHPNRGKLLDAVCKAVVQTRSCPTEAIYSEDELLGEQLAAAGLAVNPGYPPAVGLSTAEAAIIRHLNGLQSRLEIATDASVGRRTKWMGLGWIMDFGHGLPPVLGSRTTHRGGVLEGELRAIRHALAAARSASPLVSIGKCAVTLRSDSKLALRMITAPGWEPPGSNGHCRVEVERIQQLSLHVDVEFRWVKGHAGDHLNGLADRLAVLARRKAEADLTKDQAGRLLNHIHEATRAAKTRVDVALAA